MADRWREFLMHPATQMGAGIMAASDPNREGLGGLGLGIMSAREGLLEQEKLRQEGLTSGLADYSKTPTYFRDPATGQIRVGQLSPTGQVHFPEIPEGLEAMRPVTQVQSGAGTWLLPQGAAGPGPGAGYIPREIPPEQQPAHKARVAEETAAATVAGRETETAQRRLPLAVVDARRTLSRLNQLRSHDALAVAVGASSWLPVIRGTDRADFVARMDQITGGAFLQAFEQLKGGGQITQIEGEKATQAITRMSQATSEEAFFAAMDDYAEAIQDGITKLQIEAGVAQEPLAIPWRAGAQPAARRAPSTTRKGRRERQRRINEIRERRARGQ